MAQRRINRNSTTPKGFLRRVRDCDFSRIEDPRHQPWVQHPLRALLCLAVLAFATGARSTRAVEDRSEQMKPQIRAKLDIAERVSDNAFGLILSQIQWHQLRGALHRQIKAEWTRKRLQPTRLPQSTVAIDGKHLATIDEKRLRALISQNTSLDGETLDAQEMRRVLRTQFPYVQLHDDGGRLSGFVRVHRATLVSSQAAVVIDQWPIKGETNEWGTIETTLTALFSAFGRTKIIEMVTVDAGNATKDVAKKLHARDVDYFMALKSLQGALHRLAAEKLAELDGSEAEFCTCFDERGKTIGYTVWRHRLDDNLGWEGAGEVIRIERVVAGEDSSSVGNRYFVTSALEMDGEELLKLARAHWRCENEGHWTADAIWDEDARRTPWTKHPDGVLVVGLLRAMAINILAVLRSLSRKKSGCDTWLKPTWKTVIEHTLLVLCEPLLNTEEFDALE